MVIGPIHDGDLRGGMVETLAESQASETGSQYYNLSMAFFWHASVSADS
jgi:hypothetical protein